MLSENLSAPKSVITSFCHFLNTRQFNALFSLASPSATWWVLGRPELGTSFGGTRPFSSRQADVEAMMGQFAQYSFTVHDMTAEGEKVIVEGTAEGQHESRGRYRNDVVMVFTVREGKIESLREWLDAREVDAYLGMVKDEKW